YLFLSATAPTHIATLSLHDALPISMSGSAIAAAASRRIRRSTRARSGRGGGGGLALWSEWSGLSSSAGAVWRASGSLSSNQSSRSEEHTSELQSLRHLVCRLLLEKK